MSLMNQEEYISHTLIHLLEVITLKYDYHIIVPTWKTPSYNSLYYNWKRGMYAMSTAVFIVMIKCKNFIFLDGTNKSFC